MLPEWLRDCLAGAAVSLAPAAKRGQKGAGGSGARPPAWKRYRGMPLRPPAFVTSEKPACFIIRSAMALRMPEAQ